MHCWAWCFEARSSATRLLIFLFKSRLVLMGCQSTRLSLSGYLVLFVYLWGFNKSRQPTVYHLAYMKTYPLSQWDGTRFPFRGRVQLHVGYLPPSVYLATRLSQQSLIEKVIETSNILRNSRWKGVSGTLLPVLSYDLWRSIQNFLSFS